MVEPSISAVGTWLLAGGAPRVPLFSLFACAVFIRQRPMGPSGHLRPHLAPVLLSLLPGRFLRPRSWLSGLSYVPRRATATDFARVDRLSRLWSIRARSIRFRTAFSSWTLRRHACHRTTQPSPVTAGMAAGVAWIGASGAEIASCFRFSQMSPVVESAGDDGHERLLRPSELPTQDSGVSWPRFTWGWHEWGMYIGWVPVVVIGFSVVARQKALRLAA